MHRKSTKKLSFKESKVEKNFTSERLTSYSGLSAINDYVTNLGLFRQLDTAFTTVVHNATEFLNTQIFSAIIFANLCGIHRLSKIARFTEDPLVLKLLGLNKGLDDSNTCTLYVVQVCTAKVQKNYHSKSQK